MRWAKYFVGHIMKKLMERSLGECMDRTEQIYFMRLFTLHKMTQAQCTQSSHLAYTNLVGF